MNRRMLPRLKGQRVRLRPIARRFDSKGHELDEMDFIWSIDEASEDKLLLHYDGTGHSFPLNGDHVHEFRTDPLANNGGFLLLNSQIFLRADKISIEPLDPRGGTTRTPGHKDSEELLSPGIYLQQRIEQRSREVAKTRNDAGYIAMWPAAVKEVLAKYPNLSPGEKASLRGNVEGQVQLMCTRTRRDPHMLTPALQEVARILS